ncbi:MAG TPA: ADOP family duplicated permease [Vicinamibacterales bacterium]|jgi:predicted permease
MIGLHAWRSWRNDRAAALLAAAAFAAGIGAATAIYTVVNAVMLKPLPYRDGDRFVAIFSAVVNDPEHYGSLSFRDAQIYQERTRVFDAFGWFRFAGKNLIFAGEPHHVAGVAVTPPLVQRLGVEPMMGQWFGDETGVVISASLWRRLGSDSAIVGKSLTLDGRSYTVAGVMPEYFALPVTGIMTAGARIDIWIPLDPQGRGESDAGALYFAYARRKPGVSFAVAEADVERVAGEIATDDPIHHPAYTARVFDLRETVIRDIRPTLLLLLAAAALLFLITCANAAGLLLARSVARARETAMRVALGASRSQLAAHYLAESLPISVVGAAAGIVLSLTLTPGVVSMVADYLPRAEEIAVDWTVVLFAAGAAALATVLSSLAPLWQAVRTAPAEALGEGARASAGARSRRLSQSLIVAEIALAFALLAVSAILIGHVRNLSRTSAGLDADQVLTFVASIPGSIADNPAKRLPFQRQLVEALQVVPSVDAVAFANQLPLDGCCLGANIYPEGRPANFMAGQRTSLMAISPDYFRVMRIPLRRGRLLSDTDVRNAYAVAVISQFAATRYWGDRDPIGTYGRFTSPSGSRFQVVGVVGDVRNDGLGKPSVPEIYILSSLANVETMNFVVRSARPVAALLPDVRRAVQSVDPELPIHQVASMREIIQRSMTLERAASVLTGFFALAALLLATLGIYGVVSYFVRHRRVEIGTRMALGATSRDVLSLIVGGGLRIATLGVLVGGLLGLGATLYLVRAFHIVNIGAVPFVSATAIVGTVALAASAVPAWRASLLSPMVAIRDQPESVWQAARQTVERAVRHFSADDEQPAVALGTLIGELADSVRRARSAREAADASLTALQERTGASSIMLLEKAAGAYESTTCSIPAEGVLLNILRHYPHPLALSQGHFATWLRWARESRPEHVAELNALASTGVHTVVPLRTKNDVVGLLLLGPPTGREQYTTAERQVLRNSGEVFALMLENARLTDRAVEQEKVRRDLATAAEVQKRLLPPQAPRSAAATFAAFTLPARTIGGDYYDFLDLGGEHVAFALADVSGKGISAALIMSVVQASLRVISSQGNLSASQLATQMNGFLYQSTGANKYATFFYAQIDERAHRLRYVNAGHNPPYLLRCTNGVTEIVELNVGGTVLGLFPESEFQHADIDLRPGDLLVAFTDGVTDALNTAGEEFGEERLKDVLRATAGVPADEISARLADTMRDWIGNAEQHDDLTFVVVAMKTIQGTTQSA